MISEEKMIHIVHLIINGLKKDGFLEYSDEGAVVREAKKVGLLYINQINSVTELARQRIESQKSPPPEHSPQYGVLFQKYYDEEMRKKGG